MNRTISSNPLLGIPSRCCFGRICEEVKQESLESSVVCFHCGKTLIVRREQNHRMRNYIRLFPPALIEVEERYFEYFLAP
jgi:hypothetical protein